MHTKIHQAPELSGRYDLRPLETIDLTGVRSAQIGLVRFAAGHRSPPDGFRSGSGHEIATIVEGRVRVDTPAGESRVVNARDVIVSSPTEPHATTALDDTVIFYVVVDSPA